MKARWNINLLCLLLGFVLWGCSEPVDSSNLKTSGIYAWINVEATSATLANVGVNLSSGSTPFASDVDLNGGDALRVETNSDSRQLSQGGLPVLGLNYEANVAYSGDSAFRVALLRTDGVDATQSTVSIPLPFNITSPAASTSFTNVDTLALTWQPASAGTMQIEFAMQCIDTLGRQMEWADFLDVVDTGSYSILVTTLLAVNMTDSNTNQPIVIDTTQPCSATFLLTKTISGSVDANLGGGTISATQTRTLQVVIMP